MKCVASLELYLKLYLETKPRRKLREVNIAAEVKLVDRKGITKGFNGSVRRSSNVLKSPFQIKGLYHCPISSEAVVKEGVDIRIL